MNEKIIWSETPSQLLNLHKYIIGILLLFFLIYQLQNNSSLFLSIFNNSKVILSTESYNNFVNKATLYLIIIVFTILTYNFLSLLLTKYTLTNERLIIRKGIVNRKRDYTNLYMIVDYSDKANIMEQLFGLDTILIYTTDKKKPIMNLKGMRNSEKKISDIRSFVEKLRLERNVFEVN
jgi:uncharacterized membrane protein YdbT with pleckstrin-like domain